MKKTSTRDCWQLSELEKYLVRNKNKAFLESKTVFLSNPLEKIELDRIICEHFWPAVADALANSSIHPLKTQDGFPLSEIRDEKFVYTTRTLTFVLGGPDRPLSPGFSPLWFYRGHLQCSALDYMCSFSD